MSDSNDVKQMTMVDAVRHALRSYRSLSAALVALIFLTLGAHTAAAAPVVIPVIDKTPEQLVESINAARQRLALTLPSQWPAGHGLHVALVVDSAEEPFVRPLVETMVRGRDFEDEYESLVHRIAVSEWQLEIQINHLVLNQARTILSGEVFDYDKHIGPREALWLASVNQAINEEGQRIFDAVDDVLTLAADTEVKSKTRAQQRRFAIKMALSTLELGVGVTLMAAIPFSFGATTVFAAIAMTRSVLVLGKGAWETIQKSDKQLAEAGECFDAIRTSVEKLDSTKSRAKEFIAGLLAGADLPVPHSTLKGCKEKVETAHRKVCTKFYRLVGQVARVRDGDLSTPSNKPLVGKLVDAWNEMRVSSAQKEIEKSFLKAKDGLLTLGNKCAKINAVSRHLDRLREEHLTTTRFGEWTEGALRLSLAIGTIVAGGIALDSYASSLNELQNAATASQVEIGKYTALVAKYATEIPVTIGIYIGEVANDEL